MSTRGLRPVLAKAKSNKASLLSPSQGETGPGSGAIGSPAGLMLRRAVVTGPTGGVGVNLIHALIEKQVAVYAVYRPDSPRATEIPVDPLVTPVQCDLFQLDKLAARIGEDCDAFFHLAWDGAYGAARNDTALQQKNVDATLAAVKAAKALGCKVFIGAGSQSEFGHVDGILSPELPCYPDTGYGAAKLEAGNLSRALCRELDIRHNWIRILSLYGPNDGAHTMVMQVIATLLRGERPQCTLGEQVWDYIYAKDAARAFLLVAERGKEDALYCLGSGKPRKLKEYILAIRDAVDPAQDVDFGALPYYPNQVMHLTADISSLMQDTGFVPKYEFEQGIAETVAWVRDRMGQR